MMHFFLLLSFLVTHLEIRIHKEDAMIRQSSSPKLKYIERTRQKECGARRGATDFSRLLTPQLRLASSGTLECRRTGFVCGWGDDDMEGKQGSPSLALYTLLLLCCYCLLSSGIASLLRAFLCCCRDPHTTPHNVPSGPRASRAHHFTGPLFFNTHASSSRRTYPLFLMGKRKLFG